MVARISCWFLYAHLLSYAHTIKGAYTSREALLRIEYQTSS